MLSVRRAPGRRVQDLGEVLHGLRGHEGVREVVADPARYGVAEILADRLPLRTFGALELLRTKYKPERTLRAYYRLPPDGRRPDGLNVAAVWSLPQPDRTSAPVSPSADHDPGARRQVGSDGAMVQVLVSPADPSMPQLERLMRIRYLVARVDELTGSSVRPVSRSKVETVRYRPGQRHVLLARLGSALDSVYVKTDRDDSGAHAVPAARLVAELLARRYRDARAAEPVGYVEEDAAALWWSVPAPSLARLLRDHPADGPAAVECAGQALRAIHDGPLPAAHPTLNRLARRDARFEAATVRRAGAHIGVLLPAIGSAYADLLRQTMEELHGLPTESATLVHGDFKAENLLIEHRRPRVLDFDRCCWAEPAMDLGKLLADLVWWRPDQPGLTALERAFRRGYGRCDPARWERARLWAVLFQLRNAARRCALHEADWPVQVRGRLEIASAVLRESRRT